MFAYIGKQHVRRYSIQQPLRIKEFTMPSKQVTISARIPQEDAEYISQLTIDGAKTPSDKLRAIITEARQRSNREQDYAGSLHSIQEIIQPVLRKIRKIEVENQIHSEIVIRSAEWIPDAVAFLVSFILASDKQKPNEKMLQLEQGVTERLIRLMESVLQLAITEHCACYDPAIIQNKIGPVLELCRIIMAKKN